MYYYNLQKMSNNVKKCKKKYIIVDNYKLNFV